MGYFTINHYLSPQIIPLYAGQRDPTQERLIYTVHDHHDPRTYTFNPVLASLSMVSTGETFGAIEIGVFFACILYGTMLVQMYNYYKHNFDDVLAIKILVSSFSPRISN